MARHDPDAQPTAIRWRDEIRVEASACLVVLYGAELGRLLSLGGEAVRIGRGSTCDLVADVDDVSREHCEVFPRDGAWWLRDLDSTNGTWLDEARLVPDRAVPLANGARIRLGGLILKFLAGGDVEARYHEEIYQLTILDGLTGVHNRRFFEEFVERELARWRRHHRPLSLVLLDLDHFKAVNDAHGHPAGDAVLRAVAQLLARQVREESCFARLSGDEFAVALPETDRARARVFAERVRGAVEGASFALPDGASCATTVSLGLAEAGPDGDRVAALVEAADRRLYAAKQAGRNRAHG